MSSSFLFAMMSFRIRIFRRCQQICPSASRKTVGKIPAPAVAASAELALTKVPSRSGFTGPENQTGVLPAKMALITRTFWSTRTVRSSTPKIGYYRWASDRRLLIASRPSRVMAQRA